MKQKGKIHHWNTLRGIGLIRSPKTSHDIFFHLKDYRGSASPRKGESVWFDEVTSPRTRPHAIEVSTVSGNAEVHSYRPRPTIGRKSSNSSFLLLLLLWAILGSWGVWGKRLPGVALVALLVVNLITIAAYARDPLGASPGRWRIPESVLHLLSLLGGWPGARLAQTILQFRSRMPLFEIRYWGTVTLHFALLLGWLFWLQPSHPIA